MLRRNVRAGLVCLVFAFVLLPVSRASADDLSFANFDFSRVWSRTDSLVKAQTVKRSYLWGPAPNSNGIMEDYAETSGGKRLVQYFDKSRMEINNPNSDPNSQYYVTNGLLTVELITGRLQKGDTSFESRSAAVIPVAGDPTDTTGPTYAALANVYKPATNNTGILVAASIDRQGSVRDDMGDYGKKWQVSNAHWEDATKHNIAGPFWSYLNQTGLVYENLQTRTGRLFDPVYYATGLPVTEPYWAQVLVAGKTVDVLIQAFERRVLTFEPGAPLEYRVQMGNIGQHYYKWRYPTTNRPQATYPKVMAALGDSITRAADAETFGENLQYSWSTGLNERVVTSHLQRLAFGGNITGYNDAVSGTKMSALNPQAAVAVTQKAEYITILMGGNDICGVPNEASMTDVATFRSQFEAALKTLTVGLPDAHIFVASIPDISHLLVLKDNANARAIWSTYNICQAMLANPQSTAQADVDRRARVRQRNIDFNSQLQQVCANYRQCLYDDNTLFNAPAKAENISTVDYFHPSVAGQAAIADLTFAHTFAFVTAPK